MESTFVDIKTACTLVGRSKTAITRLCKKHDKTEYIRKVNNKFVIEKDFLLSNYPEHVIEHKRTESNTIEHVSDTANHELQQQISDKDTEILELKKMLLETLNLNAEFVKIENEENRIERKILYERIKESHIIIENQRAQIDKLKSIEIRSKEDDQAQ